MKIKWHNIILQIALCAFFVCAMWVFKGFISDMSWKTKYQGEVSDMSCIIDTYMRGRVKDGKWPEQREIYGVFFSAVSSINNDAERVDTYRSNPSGPWLVFYLKDEGVLKMRISWENKEL